RPEHAVAARELLERVREEVAEVRTVRIRVGRDREQQSLGELLDVPIGGGRVHYVPGRVLGRDDAGLLDLLLREVDVVRHRIAAGGGLPGRGPCVQPRDHVAAGEVLELYALVVLGGGRWSRG